MRGVDDSGVGVRDGFEEEEEVAGRGGMGLVDVEEGVV